jgi:hypothetical protein
MREVVQDGNYKNVWLNGSTHYDECVYTHYPCAVLALCDEVDAQAKRIAELEAAPRDIAASEYLAPHLRDITRTALERNP